MAIEIRLLRDNEDALANNFYNTIYATNRSIENFRWEFRKGPIGEAIYVIAVDLAETTSIKIVGIQCAIPLELMRADGVKILTAKSEDTLVHPDYRGQKLFEKMYALLFEECAKAGIKYIWGFTPALKAFERIGFQAPFKTSQALLVLRPYRAYRYLTTLNPKNTATQKMKIFGLCLLSYFFGLKRFFIKRSAHSIGKKEFSNKDSLIKTFYESTEYYFLHQDDKYLEWRITKNPFQNNYINFQAKRDTQTVADVVVNKRAEVSYIEQMLFETHLSQAERLQIVSNIAKSHLADSPLIRTLCFDSNAILSAQISLLKGIGFTYLRRGNHFVWKSLDPGVSVFPENIFLSRLFTQGNL